ncbi:MAG: ATP-binding protein [bacterium]
MHTYITRKLEAKIRENMDNDEAVVITGMRRVGKTTLLREIFKDTPDNKVWFDFENPLDVKHFEDIDYNDVYRNIVQAGNLNPKQRLYVFVDEVQRFPTISKVVKYLIDHYRVKFVLTGSASYYLKNLFPESLAGRKVLLEMFPLDFEEFLRFKEEDLKRYQNVKSKSAITELDFELYDSYYAEFMEWGGFPEVVLVSDQNHKRDRLADIFGSYYQQEIINLADYRKGHKVRDLVMLLAARVGSQLDLVKLSQELQITRITVYSYLAFLQDTYFIHLVSPLSKSIDREVSGTQKVYFCDNGILQTMTKVNSGQLLENAVYNQLHGQGTVNYYRKKTGAEIDFILNKEIGYEVKRTASLTDMKKIKRALAHTKLKQGYVVSQNYTPVMSVGVKYAQFL